MDSCFGFVSPHWHGIAGSCGDESFQTLLRDSSTLQMWKLWLATAQPFFYGMLMWGDTVVLLCAVTVTPQGSCDLAFSLFPFIYT